MSLQAKNEALREFSLNQTKSLVGTANHVTQWAGRELNAVMQDELLAETRAKEAAVQRKKDAEEEQERLRREEIDRQERIARKKAAAKAGWEKRRVNAETREKEEQERQRLATLGMHKKRLERRALIEERRRRAAEEGFDASSVASTSELYPLDSEDMLDEEDELDDEEFDELDEDLDQLEDTTLSTANLAAAHQTNGSNAAAVANGDAHSDADTARNTTRDQSSELARSTSPSNQSHPTNASISSTVRPESIAVNPIVVAPSSRKRSPSAATGKAGGVASRKRAAPGSSHASMGGPLSSAKRTKLSTSTLANSIKAEELDDSDSFSVDESASRDGGAATLAGPSSPAPPGSQRPSPGLESNVGDESIAAPTENGKAVTLAATPVIDAAAAEANKAARARAAALESERKIWATIARSVIPKVIKVQQQGLTSRQIYHRRLSAAAAREGKKYNTRPLKPVKDIQIKARRVMRELLLNLKGSEKQIRENKRKAEKEALEKAKREEEIRETQRAARKLNFLITQTELYSHFVGSKLKSEYGGTFTGIC